MLLDRHEQPVVVCVDPDCPGLALSAERHWDLHNKPCAKRFISDGDERLCGLGAGHSPPCRGSAL